MGDVSDLDQGNLFGEPAPEAGAGPVRADAPLAARMRPRELGEWVGQEHLLGPGAILPRLLKQGRFGSLLLWGPPGCGKTTLAELIARAVGGRFVRLNAVLSNVAELREVLRRARSRSSERTILFIDELHRFNKAQQDLLLPDVEEGAIRLIGATTHNPGFYVVPPLLSRSHLLRLEPLGTDAVVAVLARALADGERGLGSSGVTLADEHLRWLAESANGDLRRALNALETLVQAADGPGQLPEQAVAAFASERRIRYDADEDEHYDTASAFIKSLRGGDPDAALYWLAKMLAGGEDLRFIARRLVILASEDVGLADPRALPLAVAAMQAIDFVGAPEGELHLAHATVFLATCPKSNSTTLALAAAKAALRDRPLQPVPPWLRDGHSAASRAAGSGEGYLYSHDFPEAISGQAYLMEPLTLYSPGAAGAEAAVAERLARWRQLRAERGGAREQV